MMLFIKEMYQNSMQSHASPDELDSFNTVTVYFTMLPGLVFGPIEFNICQHVSGFPVNEDIDLILVIQTLYPSILRVLYSLRCLRNHIYYIIITIISLFTLQ